MLTSMVGLTDNIKTDREEQLKGCHGLEAA